MSETSVVHAIADVQTLQTYFGSLNHLVDECKLHMSGEGFHVTVVDPANVCMYDYCDLRPAAFEAYDAPGTVTVGLNLVRFLSLIEPADTDALVDLNVNMERRRLEFQYGNTSNSMALIDPDSVRSEPDTSDIDLPNEVVLEGTDLSHAVTVADLYGDHITIRGDVDGRAVVFEAAGDTDDGSIEYGDEDVIDAGVARDDESVFSQDYLADLTKPIPDDAEVTVRFSDEFPVRLIWTALEGRMDAQAMLAPRIQTR